MKKYAIFASFVLYAAMSPLPAGALEETGFEGLTIERVEHGKKIFSIEAGKANIADKRMGFFDIGIIKVVLLTDIYLTLYKDGIQPERSYFKEAVYEPASGRLLDEKGKVIVSLKGNRAVDKR